MSSLPVKPQTARALAALLALALLLSSALPVPAGAEALEEGSEGEAVILLKQRLFDLGYYASLRNLNKRYSADTAKRVAAFQFANGLPADGKAGEATLAALYAPGAIKAPLPPGRPVYNTRPDTAALFTPPGLPAQDTEGFLQSAGQPFVYKDREGGYWLYVSAALRVEITRYYQSAGQIEWFEAYITFKEGKPVSVAAGKDGRSYREPLDMAAQAGAVCAITDDFYVYRVKNKQRPGIVLRQGEVKASRTYPQDRSRIPSLEILAMFQDGSMKTFASDAHTAQEYLDLGVTDTWAFGPALVQEGEVPRYFYSDDYRSYREPRCALGMVRPGQYCALVITGRKEGSRGAVFGWMAEKMLEMGAVEALNLDGGGTAALMFMGEYLNRGQWHQDSRAESGIIAFCEPGQ